MKTFLTTFSAVLLAILAAVAVLYFVATRLHPRPTAISQDQLSSEEAHTRELMKSLSASGRKSVP